MYYPTNVQNRLWIFTIKKKFIENIYEFFIDYGIDIYYNLPSTIFLGKMPFTSNMILLSFNNCLTSIVRNC